MAASIGPTLPSHLSNKRKRGSTPNGEPDHAFHTSSSPKSLGPSLPPGMTTGYTNKDFKPTIEHSKDLSTKSRPKVGPQLPPGILSNDRTESKDNDSSDSDDIGPALPPKSQDGSLSLSQTQPTEQSHETSSTSTKLQREEWMTVAPASLDFGSNSRVDPTQLKNRRFNTGKSARTAASSTSAKAGASGGAWFETPEEKKQRLEDEVLGRTPKGTHRTNGAGHGGHDKNDAEAIAREEAQKARDEEMRARVKEANTAQGRGSGSLMDAHTTKRRDKKESSSHKDRDRERDRDRDEKHRRRAEEKKQRQRERDRSHGQEGPDVDDGHTGKGGDWATQEEDDPSKRGFDWQRDLGLASKVGAKQRADMLGKAKGFGGRFGGGGYL